MELSLYRPPESRVLWRVTMRGRQRVPPGRPYWYENQSREPAGTVVVQATLAGRIVYRDAAGERLAQPGTLMLFVFGEPSSYGRPATVHEPYENLWVNLSGAGLAEHVGAFRRRHGAVVEVGLRSPLLREMEQLGALAGPEGGAAPLTDEAAAVHRFVMRLFAHAEQRLTATLSPVERAVEQILRHATQPWSLKELADRFGCSREHLSRVFRQRTGQTPSAYLARARLQRAMRLLSETDLPVRAIAQQTGYANAHTLARQVRAATGRSPMAWREGQ